jgi:hypothetical protein
MVISSMGLGTKNNSAGEVQQQFSLQDGLLRILFWGSEFSGKPADIK